MSLQGLLKPLILLNKFLPECAESRWNTHDVHFCDKKKSQDSQLRKARRYYKRVGRISSQLTIA